jgi:hypothetical protein
MRRQVIARSVAVCSFLVFGLSGNSLIAQVVTASGASVRPPELAGLYRIETPSLGSASVIRFLRLFADGRSRLESIRIDVTGAKVRTETTVGPFQRHPWRLKAPSAGAATQLCFELKITESCTAFHKEMPSGDLLLFAPEANWGSPSLILRRQGPGSPIP